MKTKELQLRKAELIKAFLVSVMERKADDSCVAQKVAFVLCYLGNKKSALHFTYQTGRSV